MRCLLCGDFSLAYICKECSRIHLKPSVFKRTLDCGLEVLSFYKYSELKELILTKHTMSGYFVYHHIAKNSFFKFSKEFGYSYKIFSIAIDDTPRLGYSHTAILNKYLNSSSINPLFSVLRAKNRVAYSGKSLEYRKNNPRNFICKIEGDKDAILVDDIVTTGTTLCEAKKVLHSCGVDVKFALCIADARI